MESNPENHFVKVGAFIGGQISTSLLWFCCDSIALISSQSLVLTGDEMKSVCLLGFLIPS